MDTYTTLHAEMWDAKARQALRSAIAAWIALWQGERNAGLLGDLRTLIVESWPAGSRYRGVHVWQSVRRARRKGREYAKSWLPARWIVELGKTDAQSHAFIALMDARFRLLYRAGMLPALEQYWDAVSDGIELWLLGEEDA
jgi:hypothetical protein